jgi:hypothetical protein
MVPAKIFKQVDRRILDGTGIIFGSRGKKRGRRRRPQGERNISGRSLGKDIIFLCGFRMGLAASQT